MSYYRVTNTSSKIVMICNENRPRDARELYHSVVRKPRITTYVTKALDRDVIPLREYEYVVFTDEKKLVDLYESIEDLRLSVVSLKKSAADLRLANKIIQDQNVRLNLELAEANKKLEASKSVQETVEDKVKKATSKKINKG